MKRLIVTVLFLLQAIGCTAAFAQNTAAPTHIQSEVAQARLSGSGTYRWFGLAIYDAQLWVGADGVNSDELFQSRFAIDLTYARTLYGSKIADASIDEIKKLKLGTAEQQQQWLQKMTAIFPDVTAGTHITGVFIPNESARFYLNGKWLGEIKDPQFAQAFFSIWLHKNTSAPDLRRKLLQEARSTAGPK